MAMYLLPYPAGPHKPGTIVARNLVVCPTLPVNSAKRPESWNIPSLQHDQTSNLEPVTLLGAEWDFLGNPRYAVTDQPRNSELCSIPLDLTGLLPDTPPNRHTAVGATITVGALYRGNGIDLGCRLVGALHAEENNQIKHIAAGPTDQHGNFSWQYVTTDITIHDALDAQDNQAGNGVNLELIWRRPLVDTHAGFQVLAFRADYTATVPADGIPNSEYFDALHIPPAHKLEGAWRGSAYASASTATIAAPAPAHPPAAPTELTVTGLTETELVLHWKPPAGGDLHEFRIYRDGATVPTATAPAPRPSATITGLTPHTSYRFTVTAVNALNLESPHSAELTVSTNAVATPPKPAGGTGATGGTAPVAGTPTPVPIVGGEVSKPSNVYPAPLTGADVAAFMGSATDPELIALATKQIPIVTLLARAYTRGHGFAYVDSKHTERVPNDEVRAVILTATARLCANPDQIAYRIGSVGFSDGFSGWSLGELGVLHRYRPRSQ